MITQIDHVNLVVRDLPAMVQFYCDHLGFTKTKSATISGEWIDDVVGLKNVIADVVYLELPAGPRVELIYYQQPAGKCPPGLSLPNTHGLRHLALRVTDLDQVVAKLKTSGVSMLGQCATVPESQVKYSGGTRKRLVYFHDPEQNLLELCEYSADSRGLRQ